MTRAIPLGRKESQRLEFKGRDALNDRYRIGREVVGMLNAEQGGEIWVGIGEEEHRGVRVEGIPEADRKARSLHDFLMDSIEPAPLSEEIEIQVEASTEGDEVLRIQAEGRRERQPYALLRKTTRYFGMRVGDRLRPMTREEVLGEGQGQGDEEEVQKAIQKIHEELERVRRGEEQLLWLRLQPVPGGYLDLQHPTIAELLTDPTRTGNQRARRTFADAAGYGQHRPSLVSKHGLRALQVGAETDEHHFTRIYRDGCLEVEVPLEHAFAPPASSALRVAELLTSVVRLMRGLLSFEEIWEENPGNRVVGQLALFGLRGVALMPQSARRRELVSGPSNAVTLRHYKDKDFTLDRVLIVLRTEILENPDRIAFRMLRELFEAFGYPESEMPAEFDRKTGRLVLPE